MPQQALLWLHSVCSEQLSRLSSLDAEALGAHPRPLADYKAIQRMGCERVKGLASTLEHHLEKGLEKWCQKMLRPHIEARCT